MTASASRSVVGERARPGCPELVVRVAAELLAARTNKRPFAGDGLGRLASNGRRQRVGRPGERHGGHRWAAQGRTWPWRRTGGRRWLVRLRGGLPSRSRRRDDARRMSDFEIDDRQKHAQGAASYTDALPPSVRGSGRRSASASRRLIPYGADFRRQGSGARWRAACRSAASVGYSGSIGLDRRATFFRASLEEPVGFKRERPTRARRRASSARSIKRSGGYSAGTQAAAQHGQPRNGTLS